MGKFRPLEVKAQIVEAWPRMSKFIDDSVIYIASYMINKLLGAYLFSLHANPGCADIAFAPRGEVDRLRIRRLELSATDCDEAPWTLQAAFALGVIAVGAMLLVQVKERHIYVAGVLPRVIGMIVGWAASDAFKAWLSETDVTITGCTGGLDEWEKGACQNGLMLAAVNAGLTLAATLAIAVLLLCVKPCAEGIELGSAAWQDALEHQLKLFWQLVSRSLTVTSAVVWTFVIEGFILIRVGSSTEVGFRLTAGGALLTLFLARLVKWTRLRRDAIEEALAPLEAADKQQQQQRQADAEQAKQAEAAAEEAAASAGAKRARAPGGAPGGVACVPKQAALLGRRALSELLRVIESSSGWLVGCVWTDALFAFTGAQPPLSALGLAAALTAVACVWLLLSGEDDTLDAAEAHDQGKVRRFFLTNALAFIVGWAWVLFVAALMPHLLGADDTLHELESLGLVLLFGPGLTLGLIKFQIVSADKYDRMDAFNRPASAPRAMV